VQAEDDDRNPDDVHHRQQHGKALEPADLSFERSQLAPATPDTLGKVGFVPAHVPKDPIVPESQGSTWVRRLILAASLAALPGSARAATLDVAGSDVTLEGRQATHTVSLHAGRDGTAAELDLHVRVSDGLALNRSVLAVSVDGSPRTAIRLNQLSDDGSWTVSLGELDQGEHTVAVEATLRPARDDCEPDPLGTWVVLEQRSAIEYHPGPPTEVPIAKLPAMWRSTARGPINVVDASGRLGGTHASVLADHMLRDWELEPLHEDDTIAGPRVVLATVDSAPASWQPHIDALLEVDDAIGLAVGAGGDLRLLARTHADLPAVARRAASPRFRELCGPGACLVGPAQPEGESVPPRGLDDAPETTVLTVAGAGHPEGWEARGEGEHSLRFEWVRPPAWTLERWPMLRLPVRWSGTGDWTGTATLVVRLAGRSIATYDLRGFVPNETTDIDLRIPKAWWERTSWPIDIEISLTPKDGRRCDATDPSFPWVSVLPSARLEVPRAEPAPTGIAAFYRDSRLAPEALSVAWTPSPGATEVAQVAAVLYPFSTGGPRGPGFRFTEDEAGAHVIVGDVPSSSDQVDVDRRGTHWFDTVGDLDMPVVDARRATYLALSDGVLELTPAGRPREIVVPPLGGLSGRRALTAGDRWVSFDEEAPTDGTPQIAVTGSTTSPEGRPAPPSMEQLRRRWLDVIWIAASVFILGITIIMLRRRATPATS